jgi:pimeloyl-ACP methyl ester carboxylesterase
MSAQPSAEAVLAHDLLGDRGRPVVVLHGLGGDRHQPLDLVDDRLRARHRVVAPDLRAHGSTTLDESVELLTFAQLADDVEQLLATLDLDSEPLLLGVSLGAAVAVEILARQRIPIHGTVLIRPAWGWQGSPANLAAYSRIARLLIDHGAEEGRERFQQCEPFSEIAQTSPAAAEALLGQFDAPRARERAQRLTALPAGAPSRPRIRPRRPVLVLGGVLDPVHPMALAEQVATDLGGRFVQVPARYDAPADHRAAVRAAVGRFADETGT